MKNRKSNNGNAIYRYGYNNKMSISSEQLKKFLGVEDTQDIENRIDVNIKVEPKRMIVELVENDKY